MMNRIKAENVFTPRGDTVNPQMYIPRADLESALKRSVRKPKHIIIHGESGTGKTWLYKKVFAEIDVHYEVLNSATIKNADSLLTAIKQLSSRIDPVQQNGYDEKKAVTGKAVVAEGSLEHTKSYSINARDAYLDLIIKIRKTANKKKAYLVIENLEHIVKSKQTIEELSSLILYIDDEEYAKHNVKLVLVGTPNNLRDYFSLTDETQTIINRIQEIPEVSALETREVKRLAQKGFIDILGYKVINDEPSNFHENYFLNAISWFSSNIPQYVHDICLEVAFESEENRRITNGSYKASLRNWVQSALVAENSRLEKNINSKETKHGRKNQVIYTAGSLNKNDFSNAEIEESLRLTFPVSTKDKTINVSAILIELSSGSHPIIRKAPKGTGYRFLDPKIKIMIRWMMEKQRDETIKVKKFEDGIKF